MVRGIVWWSMISVILKAKLHRKRGAVAAPLRLLAPGQHGAALTTLAGMPPRPLKTD